MKSYAFYPKPAIRFQAPVARFVNPFFPRIAMETAKHNPVTNLPGANILREETAYKIQIAVPGLTKEQIKIELNEDQLVVSGPAASQEAGPKYIRKEFDYADFKRTFRLHKNADTSALTASFDQGILTIIVPDATPETIKINIQ